MADDNNSRYRNSDPFSRGQAPDAPATDPLAELARLIGQSDPFSDISRDARPAPVPPEPPRYSPAGPAYANDAPPPFSPEPPPRYAGDYAPRFSDNPPPPPSHNDWPGSPPSNDWPGSPAAPPLPSFLTSNDPFALPSQPPQAAPLTGRAPFDSHAYADPSAPPPRVADPYRPLPGFDQGGFAPQHPSHSQQAYAQQAYTQPVYPQEPESGAMPPPHDDEFYDDAPRGGRRKGVLTVVAVFALAVVGTAGAFGYRSLFSGPSFSGPPPVIRASGEPSKVAPPPATTADQSAPKFSYDRFQDAGKDEQVVKREETPVDLPRSSANPRVVFPAPPGQKSGPGTTATNPPSAIGEPRRVHTVPIRPDQAEVAANAPATDSVPVASAPQTSAAPPPPTRSADATPAPEHRAQSTRSSSRATHVASRQTPPPQPASPPAANAPLSLSPDANNEQPLPPPSAPQTIASRTPAASTRATPTPAAAASGGGHYLVQVSSQRSESDAQSAYRSLQSKYASVLGSHPHTVRRADLGSKGVYYRAMVGPFDSRAEAIQLCSDLKRAGGDCVVQH